MAADNIRELQNRLLADDQLREEFRQTPHDVLQRHGIDLTDEQSQRLHAADLSSRSHDELRSTLETDGLSAMF